MNNSSSLIRKEKKPRPPAVLCDPNDDVVHDLLTNMLKPGETFYQRSFLVPLIGGRYHIITQLAIYTAYILPIGELYGTYHLLREPGNSRGWLAGL